MKSPRPADRASAAPMKERHAPLDISSATFRSLGHDLVDRIADFLDGLPAGPVNRDEAPEDLRALLNADAPVPEGGAEAEQLMSSAAKLLFEHSLFNAHPRFLGYVTSPPAPIGVLAELLAAAVNANTGAWRLAPMASEIES